MNGMDKNTGKPLSGLEHLRQRVEDLFHTAPESLVLRRDYGSELFDLIDAPLTPDVRARLTAATAGALDKWEPELKITSVTINAEGSEQVRAGHYSITLSGYYMPTGEPVELEGIHIK